MYAIEKGIPLPTNRVKSRRVYPFDQMRAGDSFLVKTEKERNRVYPAFYVWSKTSGTKLKLLTAKVSGGFRCWLLDKGVSTQRAPTRFVDRRVNGNGLHA